MKKKIRTQNKTNEYEFLYELQALNDSFEELKSAVRDEILDPLEALLAKWILDPLEAFLERHERKG